MIVIKRSCNSSIRDDPVQEKITFGSFTIRIEDWDYRNFDFLKNELELKPVDLMEEIILEGLAALIIKAKATYDDHLRLLRSHTSDGDDGE